MDDGVLGIAGSKQNLQRREDLDGPLGELPATYRSRHHDVGEQQIDLGAPLQDHQSLGAVLRQKHGVAEIFQHRCHRSSHYLVVVDDEHGLGTRHCEHGYRSWLDDLLAKASGKVELDGGPFAYLAVNF